MLYYNSLTAAAVVVVPPASEFSLNWLQTNGVNTYGAAAKLMILTDWGQRYALALLGI